MDPNPQLSKLFHRGTGGSFGPGDPRPALNEHLGQAGEAPPRDPDQVRVNAPALPVRIAPYRSVHRLAPLFRGQAGGQAPAAKAGVGSSASPKPYYRSNRENARNLSKTNAAHATSSHATS